MQKKKEKKIQKKFFNSEIITSEIFEINCFC